MLKIIVLILTLFIFLNAKETRVEIGQRAYIEVKELGLSYLARIDSGARITSLHALNIKLEGKASFLYVKKPLQKVKTRRIKIKNESYKLNIGKIISFDTINELGKKVRIKARVINVAQVRNAQGVEYRYIIRLGFRYKNILKYNEVNLRDRSHMMYKLLIGRNWLNNDFIIKTDLNVKRRY